MQKILTTSNPDELKILRQISAPIKLKELRDLKIQELIELLFDTMQKSKDLVGLDAGGLSAIQIGIPLRFFWSLDYDTDKFKVYINPEIKILDKKQLLSEEGCLSIPDKNGEVLRYKKIRITYFNRDGVRIKRDYTGFNSYVIQHEYDHLNGVLFTDKLFNR